MCCKGSVGTMGGCGLARYALVVKQRECLGNEDYKKVQIRFSVYIEEGAPRTKLYNLIGFLFSFFVVGRISSKPAEPGVYLVQANYRG